MTGSSVHLIVNKLSSGDGRDQDVVVNWSLSIIPSLYYRIALSNSYLGNLVEMDPVYSRFGLYIEIYPVVSNNDSNHLYRDGISETKGPVSSSRY